MIIISIWLFIGLIYFILRRDTVIYFTNQEYKRNIKYKSINKKVIISCIFIQCLIFGPINFWEGDIE